MTLDLGLRAKYFMRLHWSTENYATHQIFMIIIIIFIQFRQYDACYHIIYKFISIGTRWSDERYSQFVAMAHGLWRTHRDSYANKQYIKTHE